jgi:hypothetical protein
MKWNAGVRETMLCFDAYDDDRRGRRDADTKYHSDTREQECRRGMREAGDFPAFLIHEDFCFADSETRHDTHMPSRKSIHILFPSSES